MEETNPIENANLTPTERALFEFMRLHPGRVLSRRELLDAVSPDSPSGERIVDVHIAGLRRKLGDSGVRTAWGVGYFFQASQAAA